MTHEDIEHLIDSLNAGELGDRIFIAALSEDVDFAKVWTKEPKGAAFNEGSYDFYFVKNQSRKYVAAVFDMVGDLHVFVKTEYRGQGTLSNAMKNTVLPKLHQDGRQVQKVTFQEEWIGEYCSRNWGFTVTGESTAELDLSAFSEHAPIELRCKPFTRDDLSDVRTKINRSKLYLKMVKEKLEVAYGSAEGTSLTSLIDELNQLDDDIFDHVERKGLDRP